MFLFKSRLLTNKLHVKKQKVETIKNLVKQIAIRKFIGRLFNNNNNKILFILHIFKVVFFLKFKFNEERFTTLKK